MHLRATLVVTTITLLSTAADAQRQGGLPARFEARIGLPGPGPSRFANVTVTPSSSNVTLEGCESTARGACNRTRRVVLDAARRSELVQLVAAIDSMPLCEPEGFQPGDPEYDIVMPSITWTGHLPRDPTQVPSRTQGPCAAPTRLAWWILQWFGVPGLTAPQGGASSP